MKLSSILMLGLVLSGLARAADDGYRAAFGPLYTGANSDQRAQAPREDLGAVRRWNQIAIDASGLDHTPVAAGENRRFGEQLGPGRSSRALAIVHIAMFDAVNAIFGKYQSYTGVRALPGPIATRAAISQAAHDTLVALYPSQAAGFDTLLAEDLVQIRVQLARANGIYLGKRAAAAILALRANDGSERPELRVGTDYITSDLAGRWRQDPISLIPLALGARWGECKPFVLQSGSQFRVPPPPTMESPEYAAAFD